VTFENEFNKIIIIIIIIIYVFIQLVISALVTVLSIKAINMNPLLIATIVIYLKESNISLLPMTLLY
jgi:hypothetical protein